jgi:hypothetical protein
VSTHERGLPQFARPVDALQVVRDHPQWYFRGGDFQARQALALLTDEAVAHGSGDLHVERIDDWWLVASSNDWLDGDIGAFFSPVPDPVAGTNTSRVEVLLTAFCGKVWTASSGEPFDILPGGFLPDAVRNVLEAKQWARVVAFLPPAAPEVSIEEMDRGHSSRHLQLVPDTDLSSAYDEAFSTLPGKIEQARAALDET